MTVLKSMVVLTGKVLAWAGVVVVGLPTLWSMQDASEGITRIPGFRAQKLYDVPEEQGSWVSLTVDPQGRLIASDQYGSLYRITPGNNGAAPKIETIPVETGRAHGLLYAFDSLYVMSHAGNGQPSGLYRVKDTNQDDQFDSVELLRQIEGDGEHGPHAIVLSPDKKSLYICAGNHTKLPEIGASRVPLNWGEDQIVPRMWDANGHAAGILAPGGWVCRTDPEGKSFELISMGYRNEYDIAFDANGELFTYDADMEWDIGTPWYRPTRICHSVPGAEFGWRSGTGKWPVYWPDSLPPVLDIGPASPTGITFGTGAKFPERYQRALFAADWSYGVIYAVHMQPEGSSFTAESEILATGPGLAVTDMVVNPVDGSLYFLIGGRRSQSALFRISYEGSESVAAAASVALHELQRVRQDLESLLTLGVDQAETVVERALPYLDHADRFLRYTARVALERMPIATWGKQALAMQGVQCDLEVAMAIARSNDGQMAGMALDRLLEMNFSELTEEQQLHWLRDVALLWIRHPEVIQPRQADIVGNAQLPKLTGEGSKVLKLELARLLCGIDAPEIAGDVMALLRSANSQEEQIHYATALRVCSSGWTDELRREYFQWFVDAAGRFRGGNSFTKFILNVRTEAVAKLSDAEKAKLGDLVDRAPNVVAPTMEVEQRPIVKNWTMDDLLPVSDEALRGRDLKNGAAMFAVGQCYKCHRVAGDGGSVGPDLTAAGRRFSPHDLLETLIEPSKSVSDQYQATIFQLLDGRTVSGRIANLSGKRYMVQTDMYDPLNFSNINADEIDEMKPSALSMMPTGLLDSMTKDDVLDLLAYLRSVSESAMQD